MFSGLIGIMALFFFPMWAISEGKNKRTIWSLMLEDLFCAFYFMCSIMCLFSLDSLCFSVCSLWPLDGRVKSLQDGWTMLCVYDNVCPCWFKVVTMYKFAIWQWFLHVTVPLNTKERWRDKGILACNCSFSWQEIHLIVITNYPSYLIARLEVSGALI